MKIRHCSFVALVSFLLFIIPKGSDGAVCGGPKFCCIDCEAKDWFCSEPCHELQCPLADITDVISSELFEKMLPGRRAGICKTADLYTYDAFVKAARSFKGFGTTGNITTRKREVAAFFAQTSGATTTQELRPLEYAYCYREKWRPNHYCYPSSVEWPCGPYRQSYYGRGPFQVIGNIEYGQIGAAIGEDLLGNPDLMAYDGVISFKSAIWHWMNYGPTGFTCHDIAVGKCEPTYSDFFGVLTDILYGTPQIGKDHNDRDILHETVLRQFFLKYSKMIGIDPGNNVALSGRLNAEK